MNAVLIDELLACCDNVATADHWITPFTDAICGLSAADAAAKPSPDERSIWEIVAHVISWLDWATLWLDGTDTDVVDWPPVIDTSDDAWRDTAAHWERSLAAFTAALRAADPALLFDAPTPAVTLTTRIHGVMSMIVHIAYHTGQIVKLREWLETCHAA